MWSRGRSLEGADDFVTPVRKAFSAAGFAEVCVRSFDVEDDRTALGVVRFDGQPVPLGRRDVVYLRGLSGSVAEMGCATRIRMR